MKKVFIDGGAGTTGLRIHERLAERDDIELIKIDEKLRKDEAARKEAFAAADIVFLCLPDAAAEAAALMAGEDTVVIDTSTRHRTEPGWTYGFPEISDLREKIRTAKRIANPGCHASGFIALIAPLVSAGIIDKSKGLSCFSVTGFSGGSKSMIAQYEQPERSVLLGAPRQYGLLQNHKHLKEMKKLSGIEKEPVFCPIVADYYSGMELTVPLFADEICGGVKDIEKVYRERYNSPAVYFSEKADEDGFLSAAAFSGRDDMSISVFGSAERIILTARYDNLGKGASGAAIQNMNIVTGAYEYEGLTVRGGKI